MACGVAVISSNASSLPEVAGDASLKLPPNDLESWTEAMIALLSNSSRRTRMIADGFLQVRNFTWEKAADNLRKVYRQLLTDQRLDL